MKAGAHEHLPSGFAGLIDVVSVSIGAAVQHNAPIVAPATTRFA